MLPSDDEYYRLGIPDDITICSNCGKPLDLLNKKIYYISWCIDCRNKSIRQTEIDYQNKINKE